MKWLRNLLKGASLTTALFIFEACYGTPRWLHEVDVCIKVVSAEDESPIKDIDVFTRVYKAEGLDWNDCGTTEEDGTLNTIVGKIDGRSPQFRFQDPNEVFVLKDTVISDLGGTILVKLKKK